MVIHSTVPKCGTRLQALAPISPGAGFPTHAAFNSTALCNARQNAALLTLPSSCPGRPDGCFLEPQTDEAEIHRHAGRRLPVDERPLRGTRFLSATAPFAFYFISFDHTTRLLFFFFLEQ